MKQTEKKDAILKYLYDRRNDGKEYSLATILEELGIYENYVELTRLADDLENDKLVELNNLSPRLRKAIISSKGVDYCEGDSYSDKGKSVIQNFHIENNQGTNVVINSSQVSISQDTISKAKELISKIRTNTENDTSIESTDKLEILECLNEVESNIERGKKPKFALRSLISLIGDIGSIAGLGFSLAQLLRA